MPSAAAFLPQPRARGGLCPRPCPHVAAYHVAIMPFASLWPSRLSTPCASSAGARLPVCQVRDAGGGCFRRRRATTNLHGAPRETPTGVLIDALVNTVQSLCADTCTKPARQGSVLPTLIPSSRLTRLSRGAKGADELEEDDHRNHHRTCSRTILIERWYMPPGR